MDKSDSASEMIRKVKEWYPNLEPYNLFLQGSYVGQTPVAAAKGTVKTFTLGGSNTLSDRGGEMVKAGMEKNYPTDLISCHDLFE